MNLHLCKPRYIVIILYASLLGGCESAPEGASVTGTVTLDGDPLSDATIVFRPLDQATGKSTEGQVIEGKFEVRQETGVFGNHRVEVFAYRATGVAEHQGPLPPGQQPPATQQQYLPESCNRYSKLTIDIQPGENLADFELSSR